MSTFVMFILLNSGNNMRQLSIVEFNTKEACEAAKLDLSEINESKTVFGYGTINSKVIIQIKCVSK